MVSASSILLTFVLLFSYTTEAWDYFVERIPNGGNVKGYSALGHSDGTGKKSATNVFGQAFKKAQNQWAVALCQADTDGDGQTNGQELGDPCCVWTQKSGANPRWTTGVSHPANKSSTADPTLWENINCDADTTTTSATPTTNTTTGTSASSAERSQLPHLLLVLAFLSSLFCWQQLELNM